MPSLDIDLTDFSPLTVPTGEITSADYIRGLRTFFDGHNVTMMLVKAVVFAIIIVTVSCYQGYFVKGGSIELGKAGTKAVVYSNIVILVFDYLIAQIMMG